MLRQTNDDSGFLQQQQRGTRSTTRTSMARVKETRRDDASCLRDVIYVRGAAGSSIEKEERTTATCARGIAQRAH